ncbi:MAG: nuclear transport factor 2 family protein [Vicinamibacteria bacterium]
MTTKEIADQLVALCRAGRNIEAVETLLAEGVVSVEARGDESMPAEMRGRDVIRGKNEWWINNHKVHSASVKGPYPNGDRFAVIYNFEVTPVAGPMAGKKMRMDEVALYTVADGKVVREEFFYDMSGGGSADAPKPKKKAKKAAVKKKVVKKAAKKPASKPKPKPKPRAKAGKAKGKSRRL